MNAGSSGAGSLSARRGRDDGSQRFASFVWGGVFGAVCLLLYVGVLATRDYLSVGQWNVSNSLVVRVWKESFWEIHCAYYVEILQRDNAKSWWYPFDLDSNGEDLQVSVSRARGGRLVGIYSGDSLRFVVDTETGDVIAEDAAERSEWLTVPVERQLLGGFFVQPSPNTEPRGAW